MGNLVQKTLEILDVATRPEEYESVLWVAGDLIQKAAVQNFRSGYDEIDSETVTTKEAEDLKSALARCLSRSTELRVTASILSALGCSRDPKFEQLYQESLATHQRLLKAHNAIVFASLIALDNLGTDVFAREADESSSQGITEVDKNVRQADRYLAKLGILNPW
jgi:hypothetical protein